MASSTPDPGQGTEEAIAGHAQEVLHGAMRPAWARLFLGLVCMGTLGLLALSTYVDPNTFTVLDWAINYEGGFVRRGLAGAVLGDAASAIGIATIHLIFALNVLLYGAFLGASYLLIARLNFAPALALLVYSPFFLTYQISSWPTAGRKEIVVLTALALLALSLARSQSTTATQRAFTVFALVLPLLTLVHEATFFFGVWAMVAALALGGVSQAPLRSALLALPSFAALAAALLWKGDAQQVAAICESLQGTLGSSYLEEACRTRETAITWLSRETADGFGAVQYFFTSLVVGLPAVLILIGLAFLPLWPAIAALPPPVRQRLALGALGTVALSLPLFAVAFDWGRFIACHAICFGLVLMAVLARHPKALRQATWRPTAPIVLVYALFWSVQYKPIELETGYTSLIGGGYFVDYSIRLTR